MFWCKLRQSSMINISLTWMKLSSYYYSTNNFNIYIYISAYCVDTLHKESLFLLDDHCKHPFQLETTNTQYFSSIFLVNCDISRLSFIELIHYSTDACAWIHYCITNLLDLKWKIKRKLSQIDIYIVKEVYQNIFYLWTERTKSINS